MIKLLGFKIGEIVGSAFTDEVQIAVSPETIEDIIEMYEQRGIKAMRFSEVEYCVDRAQALNNIYSKYHEKRNERKVEK